MSFADRLNAFSATRFGRFLGRNIAARTDPIVFKLTKGRYTTLGKPTLPMFLLRTTGAKSGELRETQLAYHMDGNDWLVVASNFGGERHPGWRYNLDANPDAEVFLDGRTVPVRATPLTDAEKAVVWPRIEYTIPQMKTYKTTTDRNIRVFRMVRRGATSVS